MADLVTEIALGAIPTAAELRVPDRPSDPELRLAQGQGDPLGDGVVAELARRHHVGPGEDVLAEVRGLAETEGGVFRELLEACCYVPAWADFAAMEPGLRLSVTTGPLAALTLAGSSEAGTPLEGVAPAGPGEAQAFAARLAATGSSLLLVPLPGEVQPGGRFHTVATRLRLIHATMRMHVLEGGHDVARRGMPISQAHMGVAIATFAYLAGAGLVRMGVTVSDDQIRSTGLVWRWVGHVLGIDDGLVRLDASDHVERFKALLAREASSTGATAGALGLLEGFLGALPGPLGPFARRAARRTAARLGGRGEGSHRDISAAPWGPSTVAAAGPGYGMLLRLPGAPAVLARLGTALVEGRYGDMGDREIVALEEAAATTPGTRTRAALARG